MPSQDWCCQPVPLPRRAADPALGARPLCSQARSRVQSLAEVAPVPGVVVPEAQSRQEAPERYVPLAQGWVVSHSGRVEPGAHTVWVMGQRCGVVGGWERQLTDEGLIGQGRVSQALGLGWLGLLPLVWEDEHNKDRSRMRAHEVQAMDAGYTASDGGVLSDIITVPVGRLGGPDELGRHGMSQDAWQGQPHAQDARVQFAAAVLETPGVVLPVGHGEQVAEDAGPPAL